MPHKRAKHSIREKQRSVSGADLPPGQKNALIDEAIPKSVARVLNAAKIQQEWAEKKRKASDHTDDGDQQAVPSRKRRKKSEEGKKELRIQPGETMAHFNRRVEDSMRPAVRSAIQTSSAQMRKFRKEELAMQSSKGSSGKAQPTPSNVASRSKPKLDTYPDPDSEREHVTPKAKAKADRPKEFETISSSAPRRLNDVVLAPPLLTKLPRGAKAAAAKAAGQPRGETKTLREGILSMAQKAMMEEERERAIRLYPDQSLIPTHLSASLLHHSVKSCRAPVILEEIFVVVAYIVVAVFSALRVYAIWNRDWRPFILVLLVGIVVPATNLYHYARSSPAAFLPPLAGCGEAVNLTPEQLLRYSSASVVLSTVTHSCAIATDALVLVLTWAKTFGIKRAAMSLHIKATLSTLLLRDGTLYFAILLLLNVVDLVVLQSDVIFNPLPIFIDVFTCILISRFMLNLREVFYSDDPLHDHSASLVSRFSNVNFASNVIGNLGAPLAYDGWTTDSTNVRAAEDWDTELEEVVPQTSSDPLGAGLETKVGA
ncbi:hypothetical protein A0H81_12146 [Grifola frondosa]|uniref:Transmembrane protein n=1 Tax=Grifola frondosa TaxID=5627 RepID=A0A1C7LYK4_GRIFR|nr:hypothetical protein A0H81_12146 [Grifola frondosa]